MRVSLRGEKPAPVQGAACSEKHFTTALALQSQSASLPLAEESEDRVNSSTYRRLPPDEITCAAARD